MKVCTGCGESKPLDAFGTYSRKSKPSMAGKRHSRCIACKSKARRFRNRGITEAEYLNMLAEQEGKCFLCDAEEELQIDHNHLTGQVRHVLCNTCNWRIGMLETVSVEWMQRAFSYIRH